MWRAVLLLLVALAGMTATSEADEASLTVHVISTGGKPVWLANVTIYGRRVLFAESRRNGDATFANVPSGNYDLRVVRYGYNTATVSHVSITEGAISVVTVELTSATLKQIAKVTVRSRNRVVPGRLTASGPAAELSDSLVNALPSLPGLTMGPGGAASVEGYSSTQTSVAINGIPVSVPGSSQNLQMFNAGVFSDSSVTPDSGGGGTISFQTQSPTLAWQGVARAVLTSDQGEDTAIQELGTIGNLGVSFTHARNALSNPLEGLRYLDSSGLFYSHRAADTVSGNAAQFRYEFSPQNTMLATAVGLSSTLPMTCTEWTGSVPCGYGPTNVERADVRSYQLKDVAQLGLSRTLAFTVHHNVVSDFLDQTGYYVNGVNEPSTSVSNSVQNGATLGTSLRFGRLLLPLNFSTRSVQTNSAGNAFGSLLPIFVSDYRSDSVSTSIPVVTRPHFGAHVDLTAQSNEAVGVRRTSATGSLHVNYTISNRDSVTAMFSPGQLGGPTARFEGVSAPGQLQFVCSEGIGFGNGPSTPSPGASQTHTSFTWSHAADRWSSSLTAYRNVQFGAPIHGVVNGLALDPSFFSAAYVSGAQQAARAQCGAPFSPGIANLYFNVMGIAERAVYDGTQLSAQFNPTDSTSIGVTYALTRARAFGQDPLLFGARSTVVVGQQLPNVPLHTANLQIKSLLGRSVVALAQANYTSTNNPQHLPAYITLDAGALVSTQRGLLSVTMTNIGNIHPGPFATASGAVPLRMSQGVLPTIAMPLTPRTLSIGYRFHLGAPEDNVTFSLPSEQFEPSFGGFSMFMHHATGLPSRAPANPFTIDRVSVFCGSRDVPLAQSLFAAEQRYVAAIDAAHTTEYPDAFPPAVDGSVQFNYRKNGDSYTVFITQAPDSTLVDFEHAIQPFVNCAKIGSGTEQEILARHLFEFGSARMDESSQNAIVPLLPLYAPEVGLYHGPYSIMGKAGSLLPPPENLAGGSPPKQPLNEPLAVMDWSGCPAEIRPAAEEILASVKTYAHAYFDLHTLPQQPEGLLITPHTQGGKMWLSIRTEDLSALRVLSERCMFIKVLTPATIEKLGLGSEPAPQLNYAPEIGLYRSL